MPIVVTFDVERPTPDELNRVRGVFERLGWERLGNTAYRYPKLHEYGVVEDWFNHVVPALMLLRAFAVFATGTGRKVTKFSIDAHSSTGYNPVTDVGTLPLPGPDVPFTEPSKPGLKFGFLKMVEWLEGVGWPYDPAAG